MTALEALKEIDAMATRMENDTERKKLWDVLTALRGPDKLHKVSKRGFSEFKGATTAVIRFLALPTLSMYAGVMVNSDGPIRYKQRMMLYSPKRHLHRPVRKQNDHFFTHAADAFKALGLNWWKAN